MTGLCLGQSEVAMHMEGYKKMKIEKEEAHGKRKAMSK
jgi:hypothetical protein